MEINELLEFAKSRANLPSDYALAKVMGIDRQIISQWKSGRRHPSNKAYNVDEKIRCIKNAPTFITKR